MAVSETDYDRKFEEMKKYIPFLEDMIKRLENNKSTAGNPRQAQLDKIRSLRDLLLDTKKRMKIENLLKCEQVLVNLYAKVERQKEKQLTAESISSITRNNKISTTEANPDLDTARNKLKTVVQRQLQTKPESPLIVSKKLESVNAYAPEGRGNALYQRRTSPKRRSPLKYPEDKTASTPIKRSYTRVLVSPEPSSRRRSSPDCFPEQLYSRRSIRSPGRSSPRSSRRSSRSSKREMRKSSKSQSKSKRRDLNITLNVPENSLESLNTSDLVSRIINCSDSDVDIDTLRELRSQILGELKQTGAPDDISDLILKSYRKKSKKVKPPEVEEGELSDSESEAIGRVYGNLVLKNKEPSKNLNNNSNDPESSRKIQINLVINPDKGKPLPKPNKIFTEDISDCEIIDDEDKSTEITSSQNIQSVSKIPQKKVFAEKDKILPPKNSTIQVNKLINKPKTIDSEVITLDEDENEFNDATAKIKNAVTIKNETTDCKIKLKGQNSPNSMSRAEEKSQIDASKITDLIEQNRMPYKEVSEKSSVSIEKELAQRVAEEKACEALSKQSDKKEDSLQLKNSYTTSPKMPNRANFYKPLSSDNEIPNIEKQISLDKSSDPNESEKPSHILIESKSKETTETNIAEHDILYRNPENPGPIAISDKHLSTELIDKPESVKHALYSPVNSPMESSQKITPNKCINEFDTRKSTSEKIPLLNENTETSLQMDVLQALKNEILNEPLSLSATENCTPALHQPKVSKVANVNEIFSKKKISIESYKQKASNKIKNADDSRSRSHGFSSKEEYRQSLKLTEKERERFKDFFSKLPLNESSDEEEKSITADEVYADLAPYSPDNYTLEVHHNPKLIPEDPVDEPFSSRVPPPKHSKDVDMRTIALNSTAIQRNVHQNLTRPTDPRLQKTISSSLSYGSPNPYATPQRTPVRPAPLLSLPNMTPIRTPNARTYEMTPSHQTFEIDEPSRKHVYAPVFSTGDSYDYRELSVNRDSRKSPECDRRNRWDRDSREVSVQRKFDKSQSKRNEFYQNTQNQSSYSLEHPTTPLPSFGRGDCPLTPSHPFGRSDLPATPNHPFGRSDCPTTPSHSFGRSDCPKTPSHPFGRSDCPTTPSHPFGRSDCPTTPSHPFGRSDCPTTPSHPFGRSDCPTTPSHPFGRPDCPTTPSHSFGRSDCPTTPSHAFGRSDCPTTPSHPFGRSDCPTTPSHAFGRSDCPTTPSHPFGRSDCPTTPSHPFGRSDCPTTPSHPFGRSDCPTTPSHPFGRSDCPTTPSHPFGRSEVPSSHYSRADGPLTSGHSFGRSDYSQHQSSAQQSYRGRANDPRLNRMSSSGRNYPDIDNNRSNYTDLNYSSDRRSLHVERYRTQYSGSDYGGYNNNIVNVREQSVVRNQREQSVGCNYREPSVGRNRREQSIGRNHRAQSIGRAGERSYNEKTDFYNVMAYDKRDSTVAHSVFNHQIDSKHYEDNRNDRRHRGRSVGRSIFEEKILGSSSRSSSVGRILRNQNNKTLSVTQHAGSSFTIDTSINTTFQGLRDFNSDFNARRQRAASVGRSLVRESNILGTDKNERPKLLETLPLPANKNYRRSASVGRELLEIKTKSFDEIKDEFKKYVESRREVNLDSALFGEKNNRPIEKPIKLTSRRAIYESQPDNKRAQNNTKSRNTSKGNYIDPRSRREQKHFDRNRYTNKKNDYRDPRNKNNSGIVYTNDNIARGNILGPGFGVKNYKIPKIKRPTPPPPIEEKKVSGKSAELESDLSISKNVDKQLSVSKNITNENKSQSSQQRNEVTNKNKTHDNKSKSLPSRNETCENQNSDDKNVQNENKSQSSPQRKEVTYKNKNNNNKSKLSPPRNETFEHQNSDDIIERPKKHRKAAIQDSDSEEEKPVAKDRDGTESALKNAVNKHQSEETREAAEISFGIDDIGMFSDPVLDNINDLIAELDNDLNSTKAREPCAEVTKSDFFSNIVQDAPNKEVNDAVFNEIAQVIEQDLASQTEGVSLNTFQTKDTIIKPKDAATKRVEMSDRCTLPDKQINETEPIVKSTSSHPNLCNTKKLISHVESEQELQLSAHKEKEHVDKREPNEKLDPNTNEHVVSTSLSQVSIDKRVIEINNQNCAIENNNPNLDLSLDGRSTPDSTINNEDGNIAEKFTSLTSQTQCDMNSDITSTHDSCEQAEKQPAKNVGDELNKNENANSLENLLSILQDKTKIKTLLGMLDDNDKIKKKLAKLSEIVSDDEDTRDEATVSEANVPALSTCKSQTNIDLECNAQTSDIVENKNVGEQGNLDKITSPINVLIEKPETPSNENNKMADSENAIADSEISTIKTKKQVGKKKKNQPISRNAKRMTRSEAAAKKSKNLNRELKLLQDDIKEMFMSNSNNLNDTGIRMCRLAKLVEEKSPKKDNSTNYAEPVVVLEKFGVKESQPQPVVKIKKKPVPKPKVKQTENVLSEAPVVPKKIKYKPGPKSKKQTMETADPYAFDTDTYSETNASNLSEKVSEAESDSDNDSVASSKSSESNEPLVELKKKKRRRKCAWNSGVIKPKTKKKKTKIDLSVDKKIVDNKPLDIPDMDCFTDTNYCFRKNETSYSCRLCIYSGNDIVHHYKRNHPHYEIPLSRIDPETAKVAIKQCEQINIPAISKIATEKYICRFCFKEFSGKRKAILEEFFWHVVSTHTGEYKQLCSECINVTRCPFNLDIPPPPKDASGQLIGYICGKCNFTQISLENLKNHVIDRHNDEQTEVYNINLAVMTQKTIAALSKRCRLSNRSSVLSSSQSNQSSTENDEQRDDANHNSERSEADSTKNVAVSKTDEITLELSKRNTSKSKFTFQADNIIESSNAEFTETNVKVEEHEVEDNRMDFVNRPLSTCMTDKDNEKDISFDDDVIRYPHFKVDIKLSGIKEYVCCINGKGSHYKTSLLISMKKHIRMKHIEKWDGYCFICKVIVTPQGQHPFVECLQHYLDQHIDNFPILEQEQIISDTPEPEASEISDQRASTPKTYINVRPMSELISNEISSSALPTIESVVSLGLAAAPSQPSTNYTTQQLELPSIKEYNYEEAQAEIMSKKHRVVLDSMMPPTKLIQIFKCAGRFCSFTTDSVEDALVHASAHLRVGGENSLKCAYCDFDASGNAIDLVMHVFKSHGDCQYACGACFYRASASRLVGAHIRRIHNNSSSIRVLRNAGAPPVPTEDNTDLVPREIAVPYYTCRNAPHCDFVTYTPGHFVDHFLKSHPNDTDFICSICSTAISSMNGIVNHLRSHGIQRYQCPRCFHGADDEEALLEHAASRHPNRHPYGYMRIITADKQILPLAKLDQTAVEVTSVQPSTKSEDATKEAEKSIDLEKLIGPTSQLFGSAPTATPTNEAVNSNASFACQLLTQTDLASASDLAVLSDVSIKPTEDQHPPSTTSIQENATITQVPTPVIKTEPVDNTSKQNVIVDIVCLDTDEEDEADGVDGEVHEAGIISLSDDETAALEPPSTKETKPSPTKAKTNLKVECPKCQTTFNFGPGLMSHLRACHPDPGQPIQCLYCPFKTEIRDENSFVTHFRQCCNTGKPVMIYRCMVCKITFKDIATVKRHMKNHGILENALAVTANKDPRGRVFYEVNKIPITKESKKRQKSSDSVEASKANKQSFEPKDIHLLPIQPIFDKIVNCALCGFNTKVKTNMIRHLESHSNQQPVSQTVPVNPVPHLETNEMHFDRMVNLASSSLSTSKPKDPSAAPLPVVPPEAVSRYPKFVPERQRHTCGAKDCSYISVDEAMLKCHWETLHNGSYEYRCVHCPPYQQLDTSRPLTATRIMAHLKMHDSTLYACSNCPYYHYKKQVVEKHINENHNKKGQVMIVREEGTTTQPSSSSAPTMDLKPWQCGLCQFKSMLRPEVAEHCAKNHQSKMQFKCFYCPFRTSTLDNVTKHQGMAHAGRKEEVFYFYYREGLIPDEDGKPLWWHQRQRIGYKEPAVKVETGAPPVPVTTAVVEAPAVTPIDTNIRVKQEKDDEASGLSLSAACIAFGSFCEPKGLKFCCPLCKVVTEDTKEAMQAHLFEELKYRRWGCRLCAYKAYHPKGFEEHLKLEHKLNLTPTNAPIQQPIDPKIELWVATLLDRQAAAVEKAKQSGETKTQEEQITTQPFVSKAITTEPKQPISAELIVKEFSETRIAELEKSFGPLGEPTASGHFNCPKCGTESKDEDHMINHLESELSAIRWTCSACDGTFQQYHTAQYHCRSSHPGIVSKPVPAEKDPTIRAEWVQAVLAIQKKKREINDKQTATSSLQEQNEIEDNSLLVPIFEKNIPTPEIIGNSTIVTAQKRPAPADSDSEDERLVIDDISAAKKQVVETSTTKKGGRPYHNCPHCPFKTQDHRYHRRHILRHFNLWPYTCDYCNFCGNETKMKSHFEKMHPGLKPSKRQTEIPSEPLVVLKVATRKRQRKSNRTSDDEDDVSYRPNRTKAKKIKNVDDNTKALSNSATGKVNEDKIICFVCLKPFTTAEASTHEHINNKVEFGKRGDIVVKCTICQIVLRTMDLMREHSRQLHPNDTSNYAYLRLHYDEEDYISCGYCYKSFKTLSRLNQHHSVMHHALPLKYDVVPFSSSTQATEITFRISSGENSQIPLHNDDLCSGSGAFVQDSSSGIDMETDLNKKKHVFADPKRIAKKSTTKLPITAPIAKKSTTKLPLYTTSVLESDSSDVEEEFSYYGKKSSDAGLEAVTAYLPHNDTVTPLNYKQVNKIIKIHPVVLVDDVNKTNVQ